MTIPTQEITMGATALQNTRTRQQWAEIINADWRKSIESIIQTGEDLKSAKRDLGHGQFEAMVDSDLDFGPRTARNLMQIADHPSITNRHRGSDLPRQWTVLRQLAQLPEEEFEWARGRGLISPGMSRGAADAIRKSRDPGTDIIHTSKNKRDLPAPQEANNIARETGRMVAASDGNVYSGATEEESADHVNRRQRTYGVRDAIDVICDCGVTPTQWMNEAEDHWLHDFRLGSIDEAITWLTTLKAALAEKQGVLDAE